MSTAAVSSLSPHQKMDAYYAARHQDLRKLGQALETGDLASAQQDYAAIQNRGQHGPFPEGRPFVQSNREQDFRAIGSALQSGDLSAARHAFEQLIRTFGVKAPALGDSTTPAVSASAEAGQKSAGGNLSVNA